MKRSATAVSVALTVALLAGSCGDDDARPGSPTTSITSTTTTEAPAPAAWPEAPDWADPAAEYLESYRLALGNGDIHGLFPYLGESVAWWDGSPGTRIRMGLRDTLQGIDTADLVEREPGPFFVLAFATETGIGYDIDWVHTAGGSAGAVHLLITDGTVAEHRSLSPAGGGGHGTDGERTRITDRYAEIADRLSSGDPDYAAEMISDRPAWVQTDDGLERISPKEQWAEQSSTAFGGLPESRLTPLTTTDLGLAGEEHAAVFFIPGDSLPYYLRGTIGGLGVYEWSPVPGERLLAAVEWVEQDHGVIRLSFKLTPEGFGWVLPEAENPWMAVEGLWPPIPNDPRRLTATVAVGGADVQIVNGTDAQRDLVAWAISRYTDAGLPPPVPRSVAFPPSATCVLVAGLAVDTGEGVDLQLCFGQEEACGDPECAPTLSARSTLLHELGHVWTVQHLDAATRSAFLEARGLDSWNATGVIRDDSGTEHAAEILAWGLLDEAYLPARLPDHDCEDLTAAFQVLTGMPPLQACPGL